MRKTRSKSVNELCERFVEAGTIEVDIGCFAASFVQYNDALRGARKCRDNAARYRAERDAAERLCVAIWDWAVWLNCEAGGPLPPSEACIPPGAGAAVRAMRERQEAAIRARVGGGQ